MNRKTLIRICKYFAYYANSIFLVSFPFFFFFFFFLRNTSHRGFYQKKRKKFIDFNYLPKMRLFFMAVIKFCQGIFFFSAVMVLYLSVHFFLADIFFKFVQFFLLHSLFWTMIRRSVKFHFFCSRNRSINLGLQKKKGRRGVAAICYGSLYVISVGIWLLQ